VSPPEMPRANLASEEWEPHPSSWALVAVAWLLVGLPLLWGVYMTVKKAVVLFR
jgi:hypothetical protein